MTNIQSTKDYSIFKILGGNRPLFNNHIAQLTVSILQDNLLYANPIIVNQDMEVVDGQHRLEVAKNNDLEIFYTIVPKATIDEVRRLNQHNKPWTSVDFVESFAAMGKPDYLWLREFMDKYGISLSVAVLLTYGSTNSHVSKRIKSGELDMSPTQKLRAEERADVLWDIRPYSSRKGMLPRGFVYAIIKFCDEGKGAKLAKAVKERGKLFYAASEQKEAEKQLQSFL